MGKRRSQPLMVGAIIGSLRKDSFNRSLFELSQQVAPETMSIVEIPIGDLPLFNQDFESGPPAAVQLFWDAIRSKDGLLFYVPEYNYSITGVLKNAIDWGSRPRGDAPLPGKPAAIMGAASGRSGTMRAQLHARQILHGLNLQVMAKPDVFVPFAGDAFDASGSVVDDRVSDQVSRAIAAFDDWVALHSQQR